jgi:hypothetical protein
MADIINIKDRMPKKDRGEKMFNLSFYQKKGEWTVDVEEISPSYDGVDVDLIMKDIYVGVSKTKEHLRKAKMNKEKK